MKNRNSTNKIIIVLGPINWGEMRRAEAGNDKKGVTFHPHFTPPCLPPLGFLRDDKG